MGVVLGTYAAGHPEEEPLIRMDEAAKPMTSDVEGPIAMAPGHPAEEDYHRERRGVRAISLSFDHGDGSAAGTAGRGSIGPRRSDVFRWGEPGGVGPDLGADRSQFPQYRTKPPPRGEGQETGCEKQTLIQ